MSQGNQLNLELIPTDLIMEIFSRLPIKSIGRFRCVSKLWGSMLGSPEFTALFMTRSPSRPRILFAIQGHDDECRFYSVPQPENTYEKSSLVLAAEFHTKFRGSVCIYNSGLIYYPCQQMICNPITGQYVTLPKLDFFRAYYLGFDPIDNQFKVLADDDSYVNDKDYRKILTLGTGKLRWRKSFHCPNYDNYNFLLSNGICINGVLYYLALVSRSGSRIVCFDVRYEKFKFIEADFLRLFNKLINCKGKLCGIYLERVTHVLCMWVLEDVEKHEWFKYVYTLPDKEIVDYRNLYVVGVTSTTGEIVLSGYAACKPFFLYYFNPERNTLQRIEVQGLGTELNYPRAVVCTFVDHVEDLRLIDAKQLKSSIYAPPLKNKERSLNIIRERPKPQHQEEVSERDKDRRYDDGKLREKKNREKRNERYTREDEDRRRRRRRNGEEMRDRERRMERKRDRENRWSDKEYKRKRREKDNERRS